MSEIKEGYHHSVKKERITECYDILQKVLREAWKESSIELPVIKNEKVKLANKKHVELVNHFLTSVQKTDVQAMVENQENDNDPIPMPT